VQTHPLLPLFALPVLAAVLAATMILPRPARGDGAAPTESPRVVPRVSQTPHVSRLRKKEAAQRIAPAAASKMIVRVKPGRTVALYARPNGPSLTRIGSRTEFGSPQALAVVRVRDRRWLGVTSSQLPNGRVGWIDAKEEAVRYARTRLLLEVDLSRRELVVRWGETVRRRLSVSIGRAGSPTPTGRFAITDKLPGARFSSAYGCCILALSGRQPRLPAGWSGGDRLAIHGTPDPSTIGSAVSAGCLHASARDLAYLMRRVPLGTQVLIHA
jgi:L,D-transpeptidase catalytic domain